MILIFCDYLYKCPLLPVVIGFFKTPSILRRQAVLRALIGLSKPLISRRSPSHAHHTRRRHVYHTVLQLPSSSMSEQHRTDNSCRIGGKLCGKRVTMESGSDKWAERGLCKLNSFSKVTTLSRTPIMISLQGRAGFHYRLISFVSKK
jgi:hypothetical protein